ncbi:MAG: glycosyltransferase family 1 protein [Flavobacteriaceae bacterium]|nr:glycosyltransferase family 1 protein [Flavobacteriaceae bacterium]
MPLPKILFVCSEFPPSPGGIGNHGFNFINTLKSKSYLVKVLTDLTHANQDEATRFSEKSGLKIRYVARAGMLPIQIRRIWAALYLAFSFRPQIIICSGRFSLWIGWLLHFLFRRTQFIAIVHGNEAVFAKHSDRIFTRPALRSFNTIVSVSSFTQSLILPKFKHQTYLVIPNAIDTADLLTYKLTEPKKLEGNPALLTVGNMTLRKGQQNVIKALPELLKSFPDIQYHCVGLKTRAAENMILAKELGVEQHITFHGKLSMDELMAAYKGCDLFVMLSETQPDGDLEGFGIAILEANFFGKPAIGSAGCGIEDAIDHGKTGYKVAYNNPTEITEAVKGILSDYKAMSNEAVKWATKHNWDEVAERYIKLFNR